MKFYSEILEKFYDDPETLESAEAVYQQKIADEEAKAKARSEEISHRKKELANAIEDADNELDAAYAAYEEAKKTCDEMYAETKRLAAEIMEPATQIVKNAQKKRVEAISAFNKEFGAFRTTYTGDNAQKEFERALSGYDSLFKYLFGI